MIYVIFLNYSFNKYVILSVTRLRVYNPIALAPLTLLRSVTKRLNTENAKSSFSLIQETNIHFKTAFGNSLTKEIHSVPSTGQLFFR